MQCGWINSINRHNFIYHMWSMLVAETVCALMVSHQTVISDSLKRSLQLSVAVALCDW